MCLCTYINVFMYLWDVIFVEIGYEKRVDKIKRKYTQRLQVWKKEFIQ